MSTPTSSQPRFPVYLLPATCFRRRQSQEKSSDGYPGRTSPDGLKLDRILSCYGSHLRCAKCATDICLTSQIISKGFTGRHGRAYLVSPSPPAALASQSACGMTGQCLSNTKTEAPSKRQLVTGIHTVSDVRCMLCDSLLGWKYDEAEDDSQRYKVGKYILETKMICTSSNWERGDPDAIQLERYSGALREGGDLNVEFDSEDEDECNDLFAGVWSPGLARKRRQNKSFRPAVIGAGARIDVSDSGHGER